MPYDIWHMTQVKGQQWCAATVNYIALNPSGFIVVIIEEIPLKVQWIKNLKSFVGGVQLRHVEGEKNIEKKRKYLGKNKTYTRNILDNKLVNSTISYRLSISHRHTSSTA